jgi:hypothetical protein
MGYNNIRKDIIINHKEDEMKEELEKIIEDIGHKDLSTKRNSQNGEKEKFSELFNRLKQFDEISHSYKYDLLSIPPAIRMVLKIFPHKYCKNNSLKVKFLRAFVTTVIPGANENQDNLVSMYLDSYYPFQTYCGYFVYDLNRRSKKLFNNKEFFNLSEDEKTQVINNALNGRELSRRLYKGAILMAQVSYYGAVYDEEKGCPLIDFPGRNNGYNKEAIAYPYSSTLFDKELSLDGHPW